MGGQQAHPFRLEDAWELDRSNPYVQAMNSHAKTGPGTIGKMGGSMSAHFVFWRIVKELGVQPSEVERMSFDLMMEAVAYIDMRHDYKNAWEEYYDLEQRMKNGK